MYLKRPVKGYLYTLCIYAYRYPFGDTPSIPVVYPLKGYLYTVCIYAYRYPFGMHLQRRFAGLARGDQEGEVDHLLCAR